MRLIGFFLWPVSMALDFALSLGRDIYCTFRKPRLEVDDLETYCGRPYSKETERIPRKRDRRIP